MIWKRLSVLMVLPCLLLASPRGLQGQNLQTKVSRLLARARPLTLPNRFPGLTDPSVNRRRGRSSEPTSSAPTTFWYIDVFREKDWTSLTRFAPTA